MSSEPRSLRSMEGVQDEVSHALERFTALGLDAGGDVSRETVAQMLAELSLALQELHLAEQELRAQNQQLEMARQVLERERTRYQELFQFAPEPYVDTNLSATIYEANHAAAALLNVPPHLLSGKPLTSYVWKDDLPAVRSFVDRLANETRNQSISMNLHPRNRSPVTVTAGVRVVRNSDGKPVSLLWTLYPRVDQ